MTRKLFLFIIVITFELLYRKILKSVQTIEDDQTIIFILKKKISPSLFKSYRENKKVK